MRKSYINKLNMPDRKAAMLKDCHLLEAAHAFDHRVFSADDKVCNHFRYASSYIPAIRSVLWGNPIKEPEQVRTWMEDGLPEKEEWRLSTSL
jgi:hypothetical protein